MMIQPNLEMSEITANLFRSVVILQLVIAIACLTILMIFKRVFYVAYRFHVGMICVGMMMMCLYGSIALAERFGLPIGWPTIILFLSSGLIDTGLILALYKNKLNRED